MNEINKDNVWDDFMSLGTEMDGPRFGPRVLKVNVPATIIMSDCLGLARKIIPNLSKSYRLAPACIISTAQQAKPNVIGHKDPLRAQFNKSSIFDITNSNLFDILLFIQNQGNEDLNLER